MTGEYEYTRSIQEKILSVLLKDKDSFEIYKPCIQPKYFTSEVLNDICRILFNYYDKYKQSPEFDTLIEEVNNIIKGSKVKQKLKDEYIETLSRVSKYNLSDIQYVKDKICEFGKKQALSEAILEAADILEKGGEYSKIEKGIKDALMVGELNDYGEEYFENIEERINSYSESDDVIERITTGSPVFDNILKGGLGKSEMGIVIAPPGRGKTTYLINMGSAALLNGYNVMHIFFENNKAQIIRNYDLRLVEKNYEYVQENTSKVLQALLRRKKVTKGRLFIKKYPIKSINVNTIKAYIRKLINAKDFKPDILILDYGSLLLPLQRYKEKRDNMEAVFEEIRSIADEFNIAVWTGAQCNRTSLSKKIVNINDLSECFAIANTADVVIALCQTIREQKKQIMRYFIGKNRDNKDHLTLIGKDFRDYKKMTIDSVITDEEDDEEDETEID